LSARRKARLHSPRSVMRSTSRPAAIAARSGASGHISLAMRSPSIRSSLPSIASCAIVLLLPQPIGPATIVRLCTRSGGVGGDLADDLVIASARSPGDQANLESASIGQFHHVAIRFDMAEEDRQTRNEDSVRPLPLTSASRRRIRCSECPGSSPSAHTRPYSAAKRYYANECCPAPLPRLEPPGSQLRSPCGLEQHHHCQPPKLVIDSVEREQVLYGTEARGRAGLDRA
jgi:hypothetical protein